MEHFLLIVEDIDPTVRNTNVGSLCRYLTSKGQKVVILSTPNTYNREMEYFIEGVPIKYVKSLAGKISFLIKHILYFSHFYTYNTRSQNFIFPLLRLLGKKYYIKSDGVVEVDTSSLYLKLRTFIMITLPLKFASKILVESPQKALIFSRYNKNVFVVPNSVDVSTIDHYVTTSKIERKKSILYIGRLSPEKGVDLLVKSYNDLSTDWTLDIVGPVSNEQYNQGLQNLAAGNPRIIFHGLKQGEELWEYYLGAEIFCLPSYKEGMSNVITEAMAFGCVVVATKVGEASFQLADGECGVIVPPGNINLLASALREIINDQKSRRVFSDRAKNRVKEIFDLKTVYRKTFTYE